MAKKKVRKTFPKRQVVTAHAADLPFEPGKNYRIEFLSGLSSIFEGGALLANRSFDKSQVRVAKEVDTGKVVYRLPEKAKEPEKEPLFYQAQ